VLGVQRGHKTFVLSEDFCWNCHEINVRDGHDVFDGSKNETIPSEETTKQTAEGAVLENYEDDSLEADDVNPLNA
jgi:hypothetical protein